VRPGRPALGVLALALAGAAAPARASTATVAVQLRGPIDPAGRSVRLVAPGVERELRSDARGRGVFPHVRPGAYRVEAAQPDCAVSHEIVVRGGADVELDLACGSDEPARPRTERRPGTTVADAEALRALPRPTDVWSVLRHVPGVVLDRVDVGGSEWAQQSLLVSHGDAGAGAVWTLDGANVTDPAALGSTAVFPDLDSLDSVEAGAVGASDVRVRTPGLQVRLALRPPRDRFGGSAHVRGAFDALQSDNLPDSLRGRPFPRNRTERSYLLGAEAGAPLRDGRLWAWGAVSHGVLRQQAMTEHGERLALTSAIAKAGLRAGRGTLSLLALRSEKTHDGRDTTLSAAPEARWRQSGPSHLLSAEDQRGLGGVSLMSRLAFLDGGFELEPVGGEAASPFEDFRGVFRGSYATFETTRRRLEASVEAALVRRALGLDHSLLVGAGFERTPVGTRWAWPGNKVLALERQSVFFRAFRLTGFALPTRDQSGRTVHDQIAAYVQDTARLGRFTLALGARLDRLSGRNEASSVAANPLVPALLPAVDFNGSPRRFRWLDLLPRASLAWDAGGDGRLVAQLGYAEYAAALGSGDVGFDNPIGREPASLTYFWIDRNGDHAVEPDELDPVRGRVGSAGIDPRDPAAGLSPHAIDPDLRAPRTRELSVALAQRFGDHTSAEIAAAWRRQRHTLWRPLRALALSDYAIRGAVRGSLFGTQYDVGYYAPASESRIVPGNGRLLANREGYRQDTLAIDAAARTRLGRLQIELWGSATDWRESFDDASRAIQDPTRLDVEPLIGAGRVAPRVAGLARDVFVNARWTAGASLRAELPWSLDAAAVVSARDGFPIPYFQVASSGDPSAGSKNVLVAPRVDTFRLPTLLLADARLSRGIPLGRGRLTANVDVFNVLDRATTLQVARDVELPSFGRPREILRPRIVRLGLEYAF
jgi:hypothetical protein